MALSVVELRLCAVETGGSGTPPTPGKDKSPKQSGAGSVYIMIVMVALGVALGFWLDRRYDTRPWWTLVCSMSFLAASFYLILSESRR
jgi:hypothetical protein